MSKPDVTVLFATYNEPQWLEWVLWGYATQTHRAFEVIVVDDGSREDTRARIDALRPQMPYRLRHFWQPDEGYQKCKGMPDIGTPAAKQRGQALSASQTPVPPSEMPVR